MNKKLLLTSIILLLSIIFVVSSCKRTPSYMKTAATNLLVAENTDTRISYSANFVITEYSKGQNYKIGKNNMPIPANALGILKQKTPNFEVLNSPSNYQKYLTSYKQAINIGIYSTDLTYCLLNENNTKLIEYFETINKLNSQIGINMGFTDNFLEQLKENVGNLDSMEFYKGRIIGKTKRFLETNENSEIIPFIVIGVWIENLYLLTNTAIDDFSNKEILDLILAQKYIIEEFMLYFNDLMINTESYNVNVKIEDINSDFEKLIKLYNQIYIDETSFISKEDLELLNKEVTKIRANFIE